MLAVCCTHPLLILLSPPLEHHIGAQHILDAAPHFRRLVVQTVLAVLVHVGERVRDAFEDAQQPQTGTSTR